MVNFEKTFLARVPALVEAGLPMDEAIKKAFEDEQNLCVTLHYHTYSGNDEWAKEAIRLMSDTVHARFNNQTA